MGQRLGLNLDYPKNQGGIFGPGTVHHRTKNLPGGDVAMNKFSKTTKVLLAVFVFVMVAAFYYTSPEFSQTKPKHATYIVIDVSSSPGGDSFNLREQAATLLDKFPNGSYVTIVTVSDRYKVIFEGYLESQSQRSHLKALIRTTPYSKGKGSYLYRCSRFVLNKGINTAGNSFDVVMLTDCEPDYDIPRAIVIPDTCQLVNVYRTSGEKLSRQASGFVRALRRTSPDKVYVQDLMSMKDYLGAAVVDPMQKLKRFLLIGALLGLVLPKFAMGGLSLITSMFKGRKSCLYWIIKAGSDRETLKRGEQVYLPISTKGFNGFPVRDSVKISAGEQTVQLLHVPNCNSLDEGEYLLFHGISQRLRLSTGSDVKVTAYLKRGTK